MKTALLFSLGLNLLIVMGLCGFVWKKGGFDYLHSKYTEHFVSSPYSPPDSPFHESTYYRALVSQFDQLPVDSSSVLFVGDSHVERGRWGEFLPVPVLNRGIGGETTADLLHRTDQLTRGAPKAIVLLTGANDARLGKSAEEILTNYDNLLGTLRTNSPSTALIVLTIPRFGSGLPNSRAVNTVLNTVNEELSPLAQKHDATVVDVAPALEGPNGAPLNFDYTFDHVHLNGAGYQVVADQLRPLLTPTQNTVAASRTQ